MTLVKCPNGHFYDPARFGNKCPHCGMSGQESTGDDTTIPLTGVEANQFGQEPEQSNVVTEKLTQSVADQDKTIPVSADMLDGVFGSPAPVVGWLVCVEGINKGTDYRLHQGRNFIGRAVEMDVCIENDNTVSRSSHAIVVYDPRSNVYLAQPGDAKELFYLNDQLVLNAVELKAGDRLSIGNTKLMFVPLCGDHFHW